MPGMNTPNSPVDANDGKHPQSPEVIQALNLFSEAKEAWSVLNRGNIVNFKPVLKDNSDIDCSGDICVGYNNSPSDNTTAGGDFSKYSDAEGNLFFRDPKDGRESIRHPGVNGELGSRIATRTNDGMISDMSGSWSVDEHHHLLSLTEKGTGIRYVIEENSDGSFRIQPYGNDGSLMDVIQKTSEQMQDFLSSKTFETTGNTYNASTDIASFTTNGETMYFDFHTGALAIGGFGPGHYIFNENGSMTMPNGDVVTKDGTVIKGADFILHRGAANDTAATEAIQAEAQNYMTNVLSKIASKIPVTGDDFSALANCYSALGAAGMMSAAASIMQGAVGSVMNEASNLMSRINTALGMNVTDSTGSSQIAGDIYTDPHFLAAQIQNHNFGVAATHV